MASDEELSRTLNRLAGGLITAVLVALILWIGQTTFRHAAILASLDEKLNDAKHQLEIVDQRQDGLRKQLDSLASAARDNDRSQFTAKDGDALSSLVRQAEQSANDLERRFVERLNGLELRVAALETQHQNSQEVAALQSEITQLRSDLTRTIAAQETQATQQPQSSERFARGVPVFLPPTDSRR
ncbi:MAG TPA: hypothetical protein VH107_17980 [Lacipirellulaceae bacterium]|jgi:chaperonin cofactor prefoldin|nr:hypothetical protein [Lacipirellulaceae bacterium]